MEDPGTLLDPESRKCVYVNLHRHEHKKTKKQHKTYCKNLANFYWVIVFVEKSPYDDFQGPTHPNPLGGFGANPSFVHEA